MTNKKIVYCLPPLLLTIHYNFLFFDLNNQRITETDIPGFYVYPIFAAPNNGLHITI